MSRVDSYVVPKVDFITDYTEDDELQFRLSGVNVSIANALRRIILSDIPLVVFRVSPHEKSKCTILANTCGLHNEIIKHRLSCIPVYMKPGEHLQVGDREIPLQDCIIELHIINQTDTNMVVTTADFQIKSISRPDLVVPENVLRTVFPADNTTNCFIDLLRLKARTSEDIPPKCIHLTCELDIATAKEDGVYNAVSTCSYGNTIDETAQAEALQKKKQDWRDEKKDVEFEEANWKLLEGKRLYLKDSFDFIIQTASVYNNLEIVIVACEIMIKRLRDLKDKDNLQINSAQNLMRNCFDIILENEDYTVGKVLEYFYLTTFFSSDPPILTFCGFKMLHPHDTFSVIRVAYQDAVDNATVQGHFVQCIDYALDVYAKIHKVFKTRNDAM